MSRPTNTPELIKLRFWNKMIINHENGCWEWSGAISKYGYGHVRYCGKVVRVHRLSYILTHGDIPDNYCICHTCDNRKCGNPKHLFIGTQKENMIDCSKKGRMRLYNGENNPNCKLSDEQIEQIKLSKESNTEISKRLNISRVYVWEIRNRNKRS